MRKNKLTPPYLTSVNIKSLNDAIMAIYDTLNVIKDSADEVTFRKTRTGAKELIINDGGKKYKDTTGASFDADLISLKNKYLNKIKKNLSLMNLKQLCLQTLLCWVQQECLMQVVCF